jgi:hypothetical protein
LLGLGASSKSELHATGVHMRNRTRHTTACAPKRAVKGCIGPSARTCRQRDHRLCRSRRRARHLHIRAMGAEWQRCSATERKQAHRRRQAIWPPVEGDHWG